MSGELSLTHLLVGLGGALNSEHPLSRVVVGDLGDAVVEWGLDKETNGISWLLKDGSTRSNRVSPDPRSTQAPNLGDLATTLANDAANHVGGNRDVLRTGISGVYDSWGRCRARRGGRSGETTARGDNSSRSGSGGFTGGSDAVRRRGLAVRSGEAIAAGEGLAWGLTAASSQAEASHGASKVARAGIVGRTASAALGLQAASTASGKDTSALGVAGVVQDGSLSALPVLEEALGDLVDGDANGIGRALDLDDTLSGLGQHLLGCDHAGSGDVLDVLDLETLAANDSAHEVVRDEETDRRDGVGGRGDGGRRWLRCRDGVLQDGLGNEGVCLRW